MGCGWRRVQEYRSVLHRLPTECAAAFAASAVATPTVAAAAVAAAAVFAAAALPATTFTAAAAAAVPATVSWLALWRVHDDPHDEHLACKLVPRVDDPCGL